ncbi:MAG TPA: Crp/Fnr family transcriptional regulator [Anaerolineales bacterium]|nr:Crp/Fnr family transcriptional regulator [Anaerolineales bacterium]
MTELDDVIQELRKIPWFQELRPEHVKRLASITEIQQVKAGDVLFREGDIEDFVYVVLDGRIALDLRIPHRGRVRFYTVEQWDIFGWSGATPEVRQRTAGASAVMETRVARMNASGMRRMCEEDHDLGYQVMKRLVKVVAGRLLVTRIQLLDMFAHPEVGNAG